MPEARRATRPAARTGVVARVRCVSGELLTIASLNTRGIPPTGSQLAERYAAIGARIRCRGCGRGLLPGGVHVLAPAAAGPPDAFVPAGELLARACRSIWRPGHVLPAASGAGTKLVRYSDYGGTGC